MFITPETEPAALLPISALSDQNELCDRYNAPAPPARKKLASSALSIRVPRATNNPARTIAPAAYVHRPARAPMRRDITSLSHPPPDDPSAMAMNGSME